MAFGGLGTKRISSFQPLALKSIQSVLQGGFKFLQFCSRLAGSIAQELKKCLALHFGFFTQVAFFKSCGSLFEVDAIVSYYP